METNSFINRVIETVYDRMCVYRQWMWDAQAKDKANDQWQTYIDMLDNR